jgi:hypothetical protein
MKINGQELKEVICQYEARITRLLHEKEELLVQYNNVHEAPIALAARSGELPSKT